MKTIAEMEQFAMSLYNLKCGDRVLVSGRQEGWVIDFTGDSRPIVYLPKTASVLEIQNEDYLTKLGEIPLQVGRKAVCASEPFKMPLEYGKQIGFKLLVADRYEFEPILAKKYPWDKGSIWKVVESQGKAFLVKEEDTGNKGGQHQLDGDGTGTGDGLEYPTFDSDPNGTQETY